MLLLSTRSSAAFGDAVARSAGFKKVRAKVFAYADGALHVQIVSRIKGRRVIVVGSTAPPGENFLEILLSIDALKKAGARSVDLLIPYDGFARQDRVVFHGDCVAEEAAVKSLEAQGVRRYFIVDIHSPIAFSFYRRIDRSATNLLPLDWIIDTLKRKIPRSRQKDVLFVAPDHAAQERCAILAKAFGSQTAFIGKHRVRADHVIEELETGSPRGKIAVIVDDMMSTAHTTMTAAGIVEHRRVEKVYAFATHGVLSKRAPKDLQKSRIAEVHVSDTLPIPKARRFRKLVIHPIAPWVGRGIKKLLR